MTLFSRPGQTTTEKGRAGEQAARALLEKKGYKFMAANYRTRLGELDLVMEDKGTVVFVEVKARAGAGFGTPQESVTARKQGRLVKSALFYIKENRLAGKPFRFDVLALNGMNATHIPNAFAPEERYTL